MDITNRTQPLTRREFRAWAREEAVPEMFLTDADRALVLILLEQAYLMGGRDAILEEISRVKQETVALKVAARTGRAGKDQGEDRRR